MEASPYQALKLLVQGYIPLDRDHFHLLIGLLILLVAWLLKRPVSLAFAFALLMGSAMEVLDAIDDIRSLGVWRWRESLSDVLLTTAAPFLAFATLWVRIRLN